MHYIAELLSGSSFVLTALVIAITSGVGLWIGNMKLGNVSLGAVCVFFVGILLAHLGVKVNPEMVLFAENFGLVLFIYALGIQVGPGFIATFKSKGLELNLWMLALTVVGTLSALLLVFFGIDNVANAMGILNGAVTNTPALGSAQQAVVGILGDTPESREIVNNMALATAITYPIGTVGVFLVLELMRLFSGDKLSRKDNLGETRNEHFTEEYLVTNEALFGRTLKEVHKEFRVEYLISEICREGRIFLPTPDTVFMKGDHLNVVHNEADRPELEKFFGAAVPAGEKRREWVSVPAAKNLVTRRILVSKDDINGRSLKGLRLRNKYGVNVVSVFRAEMQLVPHSDLFLQLGDRVTVVGPAEKLDLLSRVLGNELKPLDTPYLVSIFLGIVLGILLGMVPIPIPGSGGSTFNLGIAAGPIIVGILMGAYGYRLRLTTYITHSANLMIRTLGLTLFMAGLGLTSGAGFFETLSEGPGLYWLGIGALITIVPTTLVALAALLWTKQSFNTVGGWVCGAMANPIALDYLASRTGNDKGAVSYATVYPLGIFARVVIAQVLILLLY